MEARTQPATVTRIVGQKGVAIEEVTGERDGKEFKNYVTVWVGDDHGLQVGDKARFYGEVQLKTREHNGQKYTDLVLSNAQVLEGTLVKAPRQESGSGWAADEPGAAWNTPSNDGYRA
jgi:hypothetical protein